MKNKLHLRYFCAALILLPGIFLLHMLNGEHEVNADLFAMNTYMSLHFIGKDAELAADISKKEINRLEELLSCELPGSNVYDLNHHKTDFLSEDVRSLLHTSVYVNHITAGRFDITLYPLSQLWGFTTQQYHVPADYEIKEALSHTGIDHITIQDTANTLQLPEGYSIDFGGIAKGYAGMQIKKLLENLDLTYAVLNLGGNIQVIGEKSGHAPYQVGIRDPESNSYYATVDVIDKAIVTSGSYERFFSENGITYHHILDPFTGYPAASNILSVTVISSDGTLADAYSTALFIMGSKEAASFWQQHCDEFDICILQNDGTVLVSQGIASQFSCERSYHIIPYAGSSTESVSEKGVPNE